MSLGLIFIDQWLVCSFYFLLVSKMRTVLKVIKATLKCQFPDKTFRLSISQIWKAGEAFLVSKNGWGHPFGKSRQEAVQPWRSPCPGPLPLRSSEGTGRPDRRASLVCGAGEKGLLTDAPTSLLSPGGDDSGLNVALECMMKRFWRCHLCFNCGGSFHSGKYHLVVQTFTRHWP